LEACVEGSNGAVIMYQRGGLFMKPSEDMLFTTKAMNRGRRKQVNEGCSGAKALF
jgi:hypothetical protein